MTKESKIILIAIIVIILGSILYYQNRPVANAPIVNEEVPSGKLPADSTPVAPAEAIKGVTWVWFETVMNDGTVITPKQRGMFTLVLGDEGRATGKTDCNSYFASYDIGTDGVIKFENIGATKMFCEGSQEMVFTGAIGQASHYTTDVAGNLVLLLPFDSGSVMFTKFEE